MVGRSRSRSSGGSVVYPQGDRIISDIEQRQVLLENEIVLRKNQHAGEIIDESQSTNTNVLGGISCEMDIAYFNGYAEVIAVCFPSKLTVGHHLGRIQQGYNSQLNLRKAMEKIILYSRRPA